MKKTLAVILAASLSLSVAPMAMASGNGKKHDHKIEVCHKPNFQTLEIGGISDEEYEALMEGGGNDINVAKASLEAHLAHGDYIGPCGSIFEVKQHTMLLGATSQLMGPYDHTGSPMVPADEGGTLLRELQGTQTHIGQVWGGLSTLGQAIQDRTNKSLAETLVAYPTPSEAYNIGIANENNFSLSIDDEDVSDHGRYYNDVDRSFVTVNYNQFKMSHGDLLEYFPSIVTNPNYFYTETEFPVLILGWGAHTAAQDLDRFKLVCASEGETVSALDVADTNNTTPMQANWNDGEETYTYSCSDQDDQEQRMDTLVCDGNFDYSELLLVNGKAAAPIASYEETGVKGTPDDEVQKHLADGEPFRFTHELPIFTVGQGDLAGTDINDLPAADVAYERNFKLDLDSSPLLLDEKGINLLDVNDKTQPYGLFIKEPKATDKWVPSQDGVGYAKSAAFNIWKPLTEEELVDQRDVFMRFYTATSAGMDFTVRPLTKATVTLQLETQYLTGINVDALGRTDLEFEVGDREVRESYICPGEEINLAIVTMAR